ncbi:hypothetical protein ACHHYP_06309 [Achlya hypogyna]|uniref:Apple domain-containing protein n=1 Tax=Achlya hypogyna TaxID=1202772 RepID=A0A1V9YUE0_ACHHY|nr:hypothetical protein ACHHYP_06309 [Achlya hypogyna]
MEQDTDYYGNDIANTPRRSADACCADCKATPGCKLYVWNMHNGGTCWLKSKKGARSVYHGAVAGMVDETVTEAPKNQCPPMEQDTDYYGNDIANTPRRSADACCADCKATPGCKVYVWNMHNGGTCWLKSKKGARSVYYGAKAGVIETTPAGVCPPMEKDTDYYGNDIGATARSSADACCADCKATPGCKLYVWNLHNGGTCWLKSKKGHRTTYHGAMAGTVAAAMPTCTTEANTDYYGNDVASVQRTSADACCDDCKSTPGCRVWVWNTHNGGTCWLKSKKGTRSVYHGAVAGSIRD